MDSRDDPDFAVDGGRHQAKAPAPMSKPVLGRGLSSLLNGAGGRMPTAGEAAGDPAGVQLLLRGTDGKELVMPEPAPAPDGAHPFPRWALAGALVVDVILVLMAGWLVMEHVGWSRYVVAGILLTVGACVLSTAVWLRGQPAIRELESLNPLAEEKPRLRVQFMDELPRRRD
jgi:hypothetical protein